MCETETVAAPSVRVVAAVSCLHSLLADTFSAMIDVLWQEKPARLHKSIKIYSWSDACVHVLVTGGAGFVGSRIVHLLHEQGVRVTVLDDLSTGRPESVPAAVGLIEQDITAPELGAVVTDAAPTAVIHCAARVSVAGSVSDPLDDAAVNVGGTVNLLQACRRAGVRAFVFASSAAVYGQPQAVPLLESSPTVPLSPYGCSKLAAEAYVRVLAAEAGIGWAVCRPANIYGPGQQPGTDGAVVPGFLRRMLLGDEPVINGDGEQTRDFVHVDDAAAAFVQALRLAIEKPDIGGIYHISSGEPTSINRLWSLCAAATGWTGRPRYGPERPGDIRDSVLSPDRAQSMLGWRPQVGLADGIARTAAYWRSELQRGD